MKRVILRIAALGTVVILGLIAIAQAQRGTEESPPAAGRASRADDGSVDNAAPGPIIPSASPDTSQRRSAAPSPADNPLRSLNPRTTPTEATPPAAIPIEDDRATTAVARSSLAEPPVGRMSVDPFGLHASRGRTAAGASDGQIVQTADQVPDGSPPRTAADLGAPQGLGGPALLSPPAGARPFATQPVATRAGEPAGSGAAAAVTDRRSASGVVAIDRYPASGEQMSEAREPALFEADPLTSPAGIPHQGTASIGSFPSPGAEGVSPEDALVGEGNGQPGSEQLEGPQSPQLTVQKSAPEEIQVGKPATFRVTVRNTGTVAAGSVEIHDRVPKGTRLIGTTPRASRGPRGELVWNLGTVQPGEESTVEVQLMPIAEGEIGSVATVSFSADASARTIATKPELVLQTSAPGQVLIGDQLTLSITISNPGSGVATGVILQEHVPAGLEHPAGSDLEYEVGDLPPGESRKLELTLVAGRPGPVTNLLSARGDGSLRAEDRLNLEVIAPQLAVAVGGPKRRYLEREATYEVSVHNPGTASARQVEVVAYLPDGLNFVRANNSGHYEQAGHAVHWRLEELPTDETGTVELVAMPVEAGQQSIRVRGTAEKGLAAEAEHPVLIEGIAAIMFEMVDVTDPIEVGGETTYEVRVLNQGSKAATNVRLAVLLPGEMRAVAAEGPTRHVFDGSRVVFDGLSRLAPKADTSYRVRVQGLRPGDLRIRVQLATDEMQTPVTKEESTRVYSDE